MEAQSTDPKLNIRMIPLFFLAPTGTAGKGTLSAYICGEVEKKIHQHFNEDNSKLWKVPGAGSVGATARNQPTPGKTFKYMIGITSCNAMNLRGCILNNKTDRKVV